MKETLHRLRHVSKVGAYSLLGAAAYPMLAAHVLARQRRRSSRPNAPGTQPAASFPVGPGAVATCLAFMPDLAVYMSELQPGRELLAYDYPDDFVRCGVDVGRGMTIACRVAAQRASASAPTLLFVPGMFATATQNIVMRLARRAHRDWRYNVVVADMRDFGETARMTAAPSSMGGRESDDVVALAHWARARFASRHVTVMGFSFGGTVALSAALRGGEAIDACVAFCPPLDAKGLIARFSQPVQGMNSFSLCQIFYQWLLLRSSELRGRHDIEHFHDYVTKVAACHYGVDADTLFREGDIRSRITALSVPALIIHADDDPVVPYQDSLALAQTAALHANTNLRVVISRGGGHYGHWAVMPRWTDRTVRAFLTGPGAANVTSGVQRVLGPAGSRERSTPSRARMAARERSSRSGPSCPPFTSTCCTRRLPSSAGILRAWISGG